MLSMLAAPERRPSTHVSVPLCVLLRQGEKEGYSAYPIMLNIWRGRRMCMECRLLSFGAKASEFDQEG